MADQTKSEPGAASKSQAPTTIKKYANRRLYNTATSSYVTLEHLCQMVKGGEDFVVYDAKTGEDITRSVLTQIIVEEEAKGQNLLPISFLRQLIGFYGDSLQGLVPRYLDHSMQAFAHNQAEMRQAVQNALGGMFPFTTIEEMSKHNAHFFENAFKMFSPFKDRTTQPADSDGKGAESLDELRDKLNAMQRQLDGIRKKDG